MTWNGTTREFRQAGRQHALVWKIRVVGATETTWHGTLDGQLQSTSHTHGGLNPGKSNELSPAQNALAKALRKITLKSRSGYVEYADGRPLVVTSDNEILPGMPLPTNLCFYKPDNSVGTSLMKKARSGEALYFRKRDGMMYVLRTTEDDVEFYSRRMMPSMDKEPERDWAERFPHIYEEALQMLCEGELAPNSLILGEIVADQDGSDNFKRVSEVIKSMTDKALDRQKREGYVQFYPWDVAFWDGQPVVSTHPFSERLGTLQGMVSSSSRGFLEPEVFTGKDIWDDGINAVLETAKDEGVELEFRKQLSVYPVARFEDSTGAIRVMELDALARSLAARYGWEGWVVVDPKGIYDKAGFNFRGKADRPRKYCGKLKPVFEDDFIGLWEPDKNVGTWGTGRHQKQVGSLGLYQLDSDDELIFICNCGGGLTDEMKARLTDPDIYPVVVRAEYDSRTYASDGDKTNALRFPRVISLRDDKAPEECINPRL